MCRGLRTRSFSELKALGSWQCPGPFFAATDDLRRHIRRVEMATRTCHDPERQILDDGLRRSIRCYLPDQVQSAVLDPWGDRAAFPQAAHIECRPTDGVLMGLPR